MNVFLLAKKSKLYTWRAQPQYLSTQISQVQDTCPGNNPIDTFSCTEEQTEGFSCFDVYQLAGDPIPTERYTLLKQSVSLENNTAEPLCNFTGELTCENFLTALKYNLDFSWFITNFPSSSFPECSDTYTCTRIACWKPLPPTAQEEPQSKKLMCVYKKEQSFFVGAQITCKNKKQK